LKNAKKKNAKGRSLLWLHLKGKQLGCKFRRQYSISEFVVDFYCPRPKLAIEIDGDSHFTTSEYKEDDKKRQKFIESLGIKVLRFTNLEIYKDMEGVLKKIKENLAVYF